MDKFFKKKFYISVLFYAVLLFIGRVLFQLFDKNILHLLSQ